MPAEPKPPQGELASLVDTRSDQELAEDGISMDTPRTDEEILRSLGMEMGRFDGSDEPPEPLTVYLDEHASDEEFRQAVDRVLRERELDQLDLALVDTPKPVEEFVDAFFASLDAQGAPDDEDAGDDEEAEEFFRSHGMVRDSKDPHRLVCSVRPREVFIFDADCTEEEIRNALGLEPGEPLGIDLSGSVEEICAAVDRQLAKKKHGGG